MYLLFSLTQQDVLATAQPLLLNYLDEPLHIPQTSIRLLAFLHICRKKNKGENGAQLVDI